jgi:hypothetical protein
MDLKTPSVPDSSVLPKTDITQKLSAFPVASSSSEPRLPQGSSNFNRQPLTPQTPQTRDESDPSRLRGSNSVHTETNSTFTGTGVGTSPVLNSTFGSAQSSTITPTSSQTRPKTEPRPESSAGVSPSDNVIIFVEFSDGYSLRNMIEYLKSTNTHGNFYFTPEKILYSRSDANNTVLNDITILGCNLTYYIYNSTEPHIPVGVTISNLRKITKSIGKKDSVRLFMRQGDPTLYIQILSVNAKALSRSNVNMITPQPIEQEIYDVDGYTRSEETPNCTIPVMDFCRMCAAMNSIQCSYVIIRGRPRGAIFEGIMDGRTIGRRDEFGICKKTAGSAIPDLTPLMEDLSMDKIKVPNKIPKIVPLNDVEEDDEDEVQIRVKISTIKALSKINNLSTAAGIVRLYLERDLPAKLICNIGSYGKLIIYLRDVSG